MYQGKVVDDSQVERRSRTWHVLWFTEGEACLIEELAGNSLEYCRPYALCSLLELTVERDGAHVVEVVPCRVGFALLAKATIRLGSLLN